jgi:hypothetical protein
MSTFMVNSSSVLSAVNGLIEAIQVQAIEDVIAALEASYQYEEILLKRSLTGDSNSGPCQVCDDNEDAGWIDSEDPYPSGDDGPPFHENCVCEEEYKESRRRVYD